VPPAVLPAETLASARTGDPAAVEAVYRAYAPGVRAWLRTRVGDGPLADDLTGDAFVAVLAALPGYEGGAEAFHGWVFALVRRELAGRLRRVAFSGSGTAEVLALAGAGLSACEVAVVSGRSAGTVRDITRAAVATPEPVPGPQAERHLARLAATRVENVLPQRRDGHPVRALVSGVVVAAALVFGAGVAAASTTRPGDALYGFKTTRERLQLAMARPGDSRARLELRLGRTRLGEATGLFRAGEGHRAVETLARADAALASARAQGSDRIDADVANELDHRIEVLSRLLSAGLPANVADAAREALDRALARRGG
jgi:hypothetical protein